MRFYIVVCECSKRVQLEKEGKKMQPRMYWVEILSEGWRLYILAHLHEKIQSIYKSCRKAWPGKPKCIETWMTLQKGFKPNVSQPLRVQKIKWAGHRHFRTFLAITVWSVEERYWRSFWFFWCFLAKIRIW